MEELQNNNNSGCISEETKEITEKQLENFVTNHIDAQSDLCDILNDETDSKFWIDNHLALDDIADELDINRPDLPTPIKIITPDKVKERCILYLRETINFELLKLFLVECISDKSLANILLF